MMARAPSVLRRRLRASVNGHRVACGVALPRAPVFDAHAATRKAGRIRCEACFRGTATR